MKNLHKVVGVCIGLLVGASVLYAAQVCNRADFLCFESGPTGNLSTPFRVDSSGNVSILGNQTVTGTATNNGTAANSGPTVFTPASDFLTTGFVYPSTVGYVASGVSFALVYSTGNVNYLATLGGAANPFISTATAVNGQYIVVASTQVGLVVSVSTGGSTALVGDDSAVVFSSTKNAVGFIFSSALSQWMEVGRQ